MRKETGAASAFGDFFLSPSSFSEKSRRTKIWQREQGGAHFWNPRNH